MAVTIMAVDAYRAEAAARTVRFHSRTAYQGAVRLSDALDRLVWRGGHADEIRLDLGRDLVRTRQIATDLAALASRLDQHADWIRAERARLGRVEQLVRDWIERNPDHPSALYIQSRALPPPANTGWDRLRRLIEPTSHPF